MMNKWSSNATMENRIVIQLQCFKAGCIECRCVGHKQTQTFLGTDAQQF